MERKYYKKVMIYVLLCSSINLITSCNYVEKKKEYEIPLPIREDILKVETDFCTSIMKRDYDKSLNLSNDSISAKMKGLNMDSVFYSLRYGLFEYNFNTQNIYYQKSTFRNTPVDVRFNEEGIKAFTLKYVAVTKETAATIAILENGDNRGCITMVLGKYSGKWKVDYVTTGLFMLEGKDAIDWIKEAEKWIKQKDYVMAMYSMRMSNWLFKPSLELWHYEKEPELLDKMQKIDRTIRQHLRLSNEIDTKPKILDITPIMKSKKIYPGFTYCTTLSLDDSVAIENECSKMDVVIAKYYKNMEHDSIFVKIVKDENAWVESKKYIIKMRKLNKVN